MKLLIFMTANEQRMRRLLNEQKSHEIYLVLPESKKRSMKELYPNIHLIGTKKEYMDYPTLVKEDRIPHICYDEIWVPSSAEDNLYGYAEVYAIVCELKYRKLIWVSGSGKQVVRLHSVWQGIRDRYGICIFKIVRAATNIETKLKGYKW